MKKLSCAIAMCALLSGCALPSKETSAPQQASVETPSLGIPVYYETLDNGLKVVLSRDDTAPTVAIGVYYNIGFRIEPKDRTGFAHLFEHMMFQGSKNLPKGEFDKLVNGNGGVNNGSTRFDFTNYYEIMPAHTLETMLWVEADRMSGLNITQAELTNQQGVVKNEVKVNVLNRPYGGFPWLDMPQYAFDNWYNAHNFYGDLEDLDAATLDDVDDFFHRYYAPNNAVLVVVGDLDVEQTMQWVKAYFADIPAVKLAPTPDISEQPQTKERIASRIDALAPKPGYAFAYRMPERNTPEYYAMGLIDQLLLQGSDSLLYQKLVEEKGVSSDLFGGINMIGNMFNYNGPMLWSGALIHEPAFDQNDITAMVDEVVAQLQTQPVSEQMLDRARIKLRSQFYDMLDESSGVGKVDLLASFAMFDDDPNRINTIEAGFNAVTPALIQATAQQYLSKQNRTVLSVLPADAAAQGE